MHHSLDTRLALAAALPIMGTAATAIAADPPAVDKPAVDKAFETLKTYDYGQDRNLLKPIDDIVVATHGDAAARKKLEKSLADALKGNVTRDAADYVCRTLRHRHGGVGPALVGLLAERDLSHMARYALQAIPAPEAAQALRDALATLNAELKVGVIGSLGVRRDAESVPALAALLRSAADIMVVCAAAHALGTIGTPMAGEALGLLLKQPPESAEQAATDSCLLCAEQLLADGHKAEAKQIYQALTGEKQPKLVRLAAARGLLNVAGKKD